MAGKTRPPVTSTGAVLSYVEVLSATGRKMIPTPKQGITECDTLKIAELEVTICDIQWLGKLEVANCDIKFDSK